MNCPNCGYPKARYDVSRKILWGGFRKESSLTRKTDARTNYNAHCPRCGHKWNDQPEDYIAPVVEESKDEDQEELEESEADLEDEEA